MDLEVRAPRRPNNPIDLASAAAMGDFWRNRAQWLPTWPHNVNDRAMVVYVSRPSRIYVAHESLTVTM